MTQYPQIMTIAETAELIVECCPDWVVDNTIHCLGEGDFSVVYLVNRESVFRFAKHEEAAASLLREVCLLPRIAQQFDVRIPSPQIFNADREPAFMEYQILPGPVLTRERYLRLSESARDRCTSQVANFLAQMHSTNLAVARRCGIEVTDYVSRYSGLLARAQQHLFEKLAEAERIFVEQEIVGYLESPFPADFQPTLLHGDLSPGHVLYDEKTASVTGIIDFGDVAVGDPAWDFVFIYEDYGPDFLGRLVRGHELGASSSFLERMYRFYVLDAIEWAVRSAEYMSGELDKAIAQLGRLRVGGARQFQELLSLCSAGKNRSD